MNIRLIFNELSSPLDICDKCLFFTASMKNTGGPSLAVMFLTAICQTSLRYVFGYTVRAEQPS